MTVEQVPDIPMFRQNTAAFVHELPAGSLSNVDGDSDYVRVQVLTNSGALDRDKQLAVVRSSLRSSPRRPAIPGWPTAPGCCSPRRPRAGGDWGHANTNADLVAAARAQLAELAAKPSGA